MKRVCVMPIEKQEEVEMPYDIEKTDGFKVYGPHGPKSKKGITLRKAKRQLRLLQAIEHNPGFKPRNKK